MLITLEENPVNSTVLIHVIVCCVGQ